MAEYHKYVFDNKKRTFVGEFEKMYQSEKESNFDSWHQEDSRQMNREISLALMNEYNINSLVDIGCGKGALTHLLKKKNNHVVGLDVSPTAIEVAKSRFPDIDFEQLDVNDRSKLEKYLDTRIEDTGEIDFIFSAECLSYLDNWKDIVKLFSTKARFLLVALYIPEAPIGFVKSQDELESTISTYYKVVESVLLNTSKFTIILAESRSF